jgi:hypothetical protein
MLRTFLPALAVLLSAGPFALAATPLKVCVSADPYADSLRFAAAATFRDQSGN